MALSLLERNAQAYGHNWRVLVSGFAEPVFYLFGLGVGLGSLVGDVTTDAGNTVSYATFIAPALLASSSMNGAIFDSTFNVFYKLKLSRLYESVLATPLGPRAVAIGEIATALSRGAVYAVAFLLFLAVTGLLPSVWALLALPAALLVGWAFASVGMAVTTYLRSWQDLDVLQAVTLPVFLFSATFYPAATYPASLRWLLEVSPLYHGVVLVRSLCLGEVGDPLGLLAHAAVLVGLGVLGVAVTERRLRRRLLG